MTEGAGTGVRTRTKLEYVVQILILMPSDKEMEWRDASPTGAQFDTLQEAMVVKDGFMQAIEDPEHCRMRLGPHFLAAAAMLLKMTKEVKGRVKLRIIRRESEIREQIVDDEMELKL